MSEEIWNDIPVANGYQASNLGYTQSVISYCCRGKTKSAYGYKWKYFEGKSDE